MRKTEQEKRWGLAAAASVLLLGFLGCASTLERQPEYEIRAASSSESSGFLSEFPTQPPAAAQPDVASAAPSAETVLDATPPAAQQPDALASDASPVESTLRVHEILLTTRDGREALAVRLSRAPDRVRHFTLGDPTRLVVDFDGPVSSAMKAQNRPLDDDLIARVRMAEYQGRLRVVADLKRPVVDYAIDESDRWVVALLDPSTRGEDGKQVVYLAPDVAPAEPAMLAAAARPVDTAPASTTAFEAASLETAASETASVETTAAADVTPALDASSPVAAEAEVAAAEPAAAGTEIEVAAAEPAALPVLDTTLPASESVSTDSPANPVLASEPMDEGEETLAKVEIDDPAYVMPVQAPGKKAAKAKSKSVVTPIDGGVIEQLPPREPREYSGQRISLDFKDADIQNVLRILADVSGLNIIATEEVQGKLTMRLVDVPWDQAFDAILRAKNLDSVREGNIVRVSTVEQLKKERDAQRAADEAQKQVEPLNVRYIKVNYAKADEKLVKKIQEVLTERGSATWDERTNTIVVRDIARGILDAEELIDHFDTQTPQVLIEANIVEATEALIRDLGIQWGYTYKASPETGNAPGNNFPGRAILGGVLAGGTNSPAGALPFVADFPASTVAGGAGTAYDILLGSIDGSNTLNARLTALESEGKGKIVSRPRVVTLNNVAATIESLEILRVRLPSTGTVISTGAGGVAGSAQNATEQIRTGITLKVTPQVSSDGFIFLDVFAKSSTADRRNTTDNIPNEISREAESHVLIRNGETFVLGGVFRNVLDDRDRGVPYLRSIPVVGWAFKNNFRQDDRQELLVFVTPRAVAGRGTEDLASLPSAEDLWQNRGNP
jgi:type IV pilus assembly protein PilQ